MPEKITIKKLGDIVSVCKQYGFRLEEERHDLYVSYCSLLDLCSQGETEEEAKRNIIEVVEIFVEECFDMGTLFDVLQDVRFYDKLHEKGFQIDGDEKTLRGYLEKTQTEMGGMNNG